ncbi:MAG: Methyltransferase type 11 [Candidatus Woesebacteria bacterium GW2011_GWA1_44_23]|uniref:Methyltransferase type 11 n=2 Tax=Candidatus Woeseibacteriota TaxID=1752722 RepID=A0A837ID82_9BACT|nr:MAG: Methyltransferase type 11 [Candidatus Woesebacteria bacterium GW2011_GWA1_44_23]OGM84957.1 MAG: hypothetical protein A2421_00365 [Candidatus Woesebacteria bacterium RIFOXYC1_FULL_43_18]
MEIDFYNKVAEKFENYSTEVDMQKEFPGEDPEERFISELLQAADSRIEALDVGSRDGRFTLSVAPNFKKITAIETSDSMLETACKLQKETGITNVSFRKIDIFHNQYFSEIFGVIYSRRGPTDYLEFERLLVPGGKYIGIKVGEQDARAIKEIFGRGQNYGKWNEPVLKRDIKDLEDVWLTVSCAGEYLYTEYFKTSVDLSSYLEKVPIFEDYDPIKDRDNLARYIAEHKTEKGIALQRHRIVLVAEKS